MEAGGNEWARAPPDREGSTFDSENQENEEIFEREAVPLVRDCEGDDGRAAAPKRKAKVKKARQQTIPLDFQYANKPTGASSSSHFVGDDFEDSGGAENLDRSAEALPAARNFFDAPAAGSPTPPYRIAVTNVITGIANTNAQYQGASVYCIPNLGQFVYQSPLDPLSPYAPVYPSWSTDDGSLSRQKKTLQIVNPSTGQALVPNGIPESRNDGCAAAAANRTEPSLRKELELFIKMPDDNMVVMRAEPNETIKNIKTRIMLKNGIPIEEGGGVYLAYNGVLLKLEDKSLADYSIKDESTIEYVQIEVPNARHPIPARDSINSVENIPNGNGSTTSDDNNEESDDDQEESEDEVDSEEETVQAEDEGVSEKEVQRLRQELLDLKASMQSIKKAHRLQVEQLQSEVREMEADLKKSQSTCQAERQKMANERKKLNDEMEKRKEKTDKLQSELNEKSAAHDRLLAQVEALEKQNATLQCAVDDVKNKPCNCNVDINGFRQRSVAAEVALLKLKSQVEIRSLERAGRDAQNIIVQLTSAIDKVAKDDVMLLAEYRQQWVSNLQQLNNNIAVVEELYNEQIRQVESGVPLVSLKPVRSPAPPPPPQPPPKPRVNPELLPRNEDTIRQHNGVTAAVDTTDAASDCSGSSVPKTPSRHPSAGHTPVGSLVHTPPPKVVQPPPGFHEGANMYPVGGSRMNSGTNARPSGADAGQRAPANAFRPILSPLPQSSQLAAATGAYPTANEAAPAQNTVPQPPKKKLDLLVDGIVAKVPGLSREDALKGIEGYRETTASRSLKGIPWNELVGSVCAYLMQTRDQPEQRVFPTLNGGFPVHGQVPLTTASSNEFSRNTSAASAATKQVSQPPKTSRHHDDECVVCLEKLSSAKVLVMDCSHVGHEACLQQWFIQQKSCPVCRSLTLPPDEYPQLR